jgi:release factor glutamine methyltransferase
MPETVTGLIRQGAKQLALRGIETSALDARLLMQAAADISHEDIVAESEVIVAPDVESRFWQLMERRAAFEPISRILGLREFYGREFSVTPAVLDPRGDTEILIDAALSLAKNRSPFRIADLGTGSGAIAITLLAELQDASGIATDVSAAALAVAMQNAEALGVSSRVQFARTNWLEGLDEKFDLIVSNPPYIRKGDIAGLAVDVRGFDPRIALDGGEDGLAAYRSIAAEAGEFLAPLGHVLLEIGAGQEADVKNLFEIQDFAHLSSHRDLGGHVRCICFIKA